MKLGLGTVQFGVDYGISNTSGQTPLSEVEHILREALSSDVLTLDTAALYGSSEQVLGSVLAGFSANAFSIVTKTAKCKGSQVQEEDIDLFRSMFHDSLRKLRTSSVYGLLLHQAQDLLLPGGDRIYDLLRGFQAEGLVTKIGVSVYSPEEVEKVLERYEVDLVQLPMNVLDQRMRTSGVLAYMKKQGIEVHVRSAFLQGLLLMDLKKIPAYFNPIRPLLESYHADLINHGLDPVQGALGFVHALPEIDKIICGVNHAVQLRELVGAIQTAAVTMDYEKYRIDDLNYINPANWKL